MRFTDVTGERAELLIQDRQQKKVRVLLMWHCVVCNRA